MNILYLCCDPGVPVLGRKGASVHVRALISAFASDGHEVALAAPSLVADSSEPAASVDARLIHVPIPPEAAGAMNALNRFGDRVGVPTSAGNDLRRILFNEDVETPVLTALEAFTPDCVYERATVYGTAGVAIARRLGVPLAIELNAPLALEHTTYRGKTFSDLAGAAERYTLANADRVFTVSPALRDYVVAQGMDGTRVHTLPNGVDTRVFSPAAASHAVRRRWNIGKGPVLGFVGGLRPWHGVRALPPLLEGLAVVYPGVQLIIVGDGPMRAELEEAFVRRGVEDRVRFIGSVPHEDVAAIICTFDIALAPYEPAEHLFYFSPLKLFEYMACGVAVVGAGLGQIAEVVRDGEDGLLYTPGSDDSLLIACTRLLADADLRDRLGRQAAATAQRYTWKRNAARIVREIEHARVGAGAA